MVAAAPVGAQNLGPSYPLGAHFGFWFLNGLPSWVTSNASYANGASMVTNWTQSNTDGTVGQDYLRSCNCTANANTLWTRPAAVAGAEGTAFDASGNVVDYTGQTNRIRNSTMQGAVAGTPGTLPTNWSTANTSGLSTQVVGSGTVNGLKYVDIRYFGTTTGVNSSLKIVELETRTAIAALNGQTWTSSAYLAVQAGTLTNVTSLTLAVIEVDSSGNTQNSGVSSQISGSSLNRYAITRTNTASTTAFEDINIQSSWASGVAVDFTLRIAAPQLQQSATASPPIPTYGAAASAMRVTSAGLTTEEARTNLFLNTAVPATQTITVTNAATYTISCQGTGSLALTGAIVGTATCGHPGTPKSGSTTTTSLTVTPSGTVTFPQVELGAFATSPIPTSGTAVTRAQDGIAAVGASGWLSSTTASIMVAGNSEISTTTALGRLFNVSDGTNTNTIELFQSSATITAQSNAGGGAIAGFSIVAGTIFKAAYAQGALQAGGAVNGGTVTTFTNGALSGAYNQAFLGNRADGARPFSGTIAQDAFAPVSWSQSQLQAVTQ